MMSASVLSSMSSWRAEEQRQHGMLSSASHLHDNHSDNGDMKDRYLDNLQLDGLFLCYNIV